MACLLPQFKCFSSPDAHLRPSLPSPLPKPRDSGCFLSQCALTSMAAVIEVERSPSLEARSASSLGALRPLTYVADHGPPTKTSMEATLATEALLTSEEAVIVAAAAEALALARAAVEVAKEAAEMFGHSLSVRSDKPDNLAAKDTLQLENMWLMEMESDHRTSSIAPESISGADQMLNNFVKDIELSSTMYDELQLQEVQEAPNIAVRSGRQTERRARRARAADKVAPAVIPVKSGFTGKKKRSTIQEIDYADPLWFLRGTTTTSKLLTANDELELSEGIQDLLKLERLQEELAECNGGKPTFAQWAATAGVDKKALRKRLNYGSHCKDKMIKSNIRLVISIAKNYQGAGMNLVDLVQEGCRGLAKGAEKFDASKGFKFSTYAHWWIKQAVRKSLSERSRTIRLPFHMVEATYRVRQAKKQLYSENRRHPDHKEVAEAAGLSMKRFEAVMLTPKAPRSLDQKIGINQSLKPSEVIADPDAETAEELLAKQFMKHDLNKVLDTLSPRESKVVRWRFGLDDGRMKTLQEIGESMGVSRERIRQIESCAFRKLKSKKRIKNLLQYLIS